MWKRSENICIISESYEPSIKKKRKKKENA